MAIFKCKMCGGNLEIQEGIKIIECDYCGAKQTLPNTKDENIQTLFNRANLLRIKGEFDKAEQIYEKILQANEQEAEAYWGLILCKYGIEYVEDPVTFKRVPTCHRAAFEAVTADEDYKRAILYADITQRTVYETEAKAIEEIQKEILSISRNEKPYDVFICYKETDETGRRTIDSTIANDIYYQLTQEGFKVFYAAITLEDKLGQEYEPYIFAALNSAKVMLALGTKPEYFNAVWVKNEWSRFLKIMKTDRSKILIPCYRDMDAYELPEEFSHLQAQDMSKIGFVNDVIRGIKKVIQPIESATKNAKETIAVSGNTNTASLLKRAFMFLEDGDWNSANEYCEKVLDIDPECADAYLGKLMAELKVQKQEDLKDCAFPFNHSKNYEKVVRFADDKLKMDLNGCIDYINDRNEKARVDGIYNRAVNTMSAATTENEYKEAAGLFETVREHLDSATLAQTCYEKAEIARKDAILAEGKAKMTGELTSNYESAIRSFESISGWKDADEQIAVCQKKIEQIIIKAEEERIECERKKEEERVEREHKAEIARKEAERIAKRNKMIVIILIAIVFSIIPFKRVYDTVIVPNRKYNNAIAFMDEGNYNAAISAFTLLDGYKDSETKINECNTAILDGKYNDAVVLMDEGKYIEAINAFKLLDGYKDSETKINECNTAVFDIRKKQFKNIKVGMNIKLGTYKQKDDRKEEDIEWLVLEVKDGKALLISKYALACKKYNEIEKDVTWETCSLRKWLNGNFINTAFSDEEKSIISKVTVSAAKNPKYSTSAGGDTKDQIFILSIAEVNKYFSSAGARKCKPVEFAVTRGAYADYESGNCWWWLRSPGIYQSAAAYVFIDGEIEKRGAYVNHEDAAVRPAMWIDLTP